MEQAQQAHAGRPLPVRPVAQTAPQVTVGFPVYNGARYLRQALDSLLAQDHPSFEIVLSDNGSTDETPAICAEYAARDPRLRVIRHQVNRGAGWNFNHVVHQARGKYFMWAAHDDLWRADCLSLYTRALEADPQAMLVYGHAVPVGVAGTPVAEPYSGFVNDAATSRERLRRLLDHWELHAAIYGMYRMSALRRTRLILSRLSCEIIFLAEVAVQGKTLELSERCSFKRIPDPGQRYRSSEEQLAYLDPATHARRRRSPFPALFVTLETMRFIGTTDAIRSPAERAPLLYECLRAYLTGRLAVDIKEEITLRLAPHGAALDALRSVYRAFRRRGPAKKTT